MIDRGFPLLIVFRKQWDESIDDRMEPTMLHLLCYFVILEATSGGSLISKDPSQLEHPVKTISSLVLSDYLFLHTGIRFDELT